MWHISEKHLLLKNVQCQRLERSAVIIATRGTHSAVGWWREWLWDPAELSEGSDVTEGVKYENKGQEAAIEIWNVGVKNYFLKLNIKLN